MCGNVRYELSAMPLWCGYCHCDSCRRNTGAPASVFIGVRPSAVKFSGADRKIYPSSVGVRRGFCPNCGTPISYEADRWPNEIHFYVGTLDNSEVFPPSFHVYCAEQLCWHDIDDQLPRHEQSTHG